MPEPIVFITTMEIHEGKLDAFKEGATKSMEFIQAKGPQVMAGVYVDEANRRAHGVQVHRDSESFLTHFRLADQHMRNVMQHVTVKRVDIYGRPSKEVLETMQKIVTEDVILTVTPRFAGFERFLAPAASVRV